ncbi:MAG: hypothetical protein ACI9LX_004454 [Paraglaciecola sp.]|jgi:hypothetical protein
MQIYTSLIVFIVCTISFFIAFVCFVLFSVTTHSKNRSLEMHVIQYAHLGYFDKDKKLVGMHTEDSSSVCI